METFKVGHYVKVQNATSTFYNLVGRIAVDDEGDSFRYGVKFPDHPGWVYFDKDELQLLPAWLEELQYEESHPASENFGILVQEVVNEVRDTLIAKNKAYGNSALEPVRVFSTADPIEQLKVRLDDKLSRLKSSLNDDNEDTVLDLMGYLVLLRIATRKQDTE